MRVSRRGLVVALAFLSSFVAAQQSDQVLAERVLGPQWKQLSRRAGMIFAGTVLTAAAQTVNSPTAATDRIDPGTTPAVQLSFRVDEAIAGVERGQVLTIHEWAGAWSMHRPMSKGQRFLIFLYPPSRLGLTSPVGGSLGQIALDPSGQTVSFVHVVRKDAQNGDAQNPDAPSPNAPKLAASMAIVRRKELSSQPGAPLGTRSVSVIQLARAIRAARGE
ncbi:MAG TPA: hypothetical protein VJX30_10990 [Terriglobales bacterium]|jgi:hypothetical protein|nr:hypothetical protein [Terriglobales bacterium]